MLSFTLAQTDAWVAGESASGANGDLQRFIAAKQWKKIEEDSWKLTVAVNAKKRAADRPEELQKKKKKWLQRSDVISFVSDLKKNMVRLEKKDLTSSSTSSTSSSYFLFLPLLWLLLWEHSLIGRNFVSGVIFLWVLIRQNFSDFVKVLKKSPKFVFKTPKKVLKYDQNLS